MSLAATALRLALVETLQPGGPDAAGPWPTAADQRIYDSEMRAVDFRADETRRPVIAVYTDEDETTNDSNAFDDDGADTRITLVIEIAVPEAVDQDGETLVVLTETDMALAATIDLIRFQIARIIRHRWEAGPLSRVLVSAPTVKSSPYRDGDTATRIAGRRIECECRVRNLRDDGTGTGIAALPTPLRQVAEAMPAGTPRHAMLMVLGEALAGRLTHPLVDLIALAGQVSRVPGDAPAPANHPETTPPTGEIVGSVDFTP